MGSGVWKFFGRNLEVQRPRTPGSTLGGMEASRRAEVQGFDSEWSGRWDKKTRDYKNPTN